MKWLLMLLLVALAAPLTAQTADTTRQARPRTVPVSVVDSIITITIKPAVPVPVTLTAVVVSPDKVSLATSTTTAFTATATYSDGSTGPLTGVSWSATGGTISAAGIYAANATAGTFRVIGRSGNRADTSAVTLTKPVPPAIVGLTIEPTTTSLTPGGTQTFSALGWLAGGGPPVSPPVTWKATGGSITSAGVFKAGTTPGNYTVTASLTNGSNVETAAVTVLGSSTTPPPGGSMYFNSAEAGCGTDANVLLCDDFEDGDWYAKNCDAANASGGLLQTDGWCGTIYHDPITPAKAVVCGNAGYRSNCAATQGQTTGGEGGMNMADHSLATPVKEMYLRWYLKPLAGYKFGAEKVLTVNKDPAGVGGIYWGNLHMNCGGGDASTGQLQWQPVAPAPDGCKNIFAIQGGHWTFIELHMNVATGVLQVWADDCGTDGAGCTGTPTLRLDLTGWKYPSTSNNIASVWFENWANPGSVGTRLLDQIKVSRMGPIGFMK